MSDQLNMLIQELTEILEKYRNAPENAPDPTLPGRFEPLTGRLPDVSGGQHASYLRVISIDFAGRSAAKYITEMVPASQPFDEELLRKVGEVLSTFGKK